MKLTKWIIMAVACIVTVPAFGEKKIDFIGEWDKFKKTILEIPIEGNIEETTGELSLVFTEDIGDVTVTVTDKNGNIVYQESVATGNTSSWSMILDQSVKEGKVTVTDGYNSVYAEL